MDVLDNANVIAQRDTMDALGLAAQTAGQLTHEFGFSASTPTHEIRNVVFAGMGGSALQAEFAQTWPSLRVPFVICKQYALPDFVDTHTLVIVSSYSGNTEETLEALETARTKGATIVVSAGGGILQERAQAYGLPLVVVPKALQPRMAVFYAFRALVEICVAYDLADSTVFDELARASQHVQASIESWKKEVPTEHNPAKQLALKIMGKTPIIYAGPKMWPAAYKWKISFNESSKNTAWCGAYPEFNHNEFLGWSSHPIDKPFAVINLISSFEHERVLRRFEISDRLLSGMRPAPYTVAAQGKSVLEQMLYLVLFGDFVSLYVGLLNGVDPSPVELVERLKKELNAEV